VHGSRAVLLSGKSKGRPRKCPNYPLVSGNVWHVDKSFPAAKLPASTNALIPKQGKQRSGRPHRPGLLQRQASCPNHPMCTHCDLKQ